MFDRFNGFNTFGSEATANGSRFACSSSDNTGLLLTMDAAFAASVFVAVHGVLVSVIGIIGIIVRSLLIITGFETRPQTVPAV